MHVILSTQTCMDIYVVVVLMCFAHVFQTANTNAFTADLIQRDSFASPFHNPNQSESDIILNVIARSVKNYNSNHNQITLHNHPTADIFNHGREYLMKIQLGTPPVDIIAVVDTGSDLTWTQCHPCSRCVTQSTPLFNTHVSSSYVKILCENSKPCPNMFHSKCQADGYCHYNIRYGDGSYSNGILSKEIMRIGTDRNSVEIYDFKFGCGYYNGGFYGGVGSGVIGLGAGPYSLITQLGRQLAMQTFSYCLIPFTLRNLTSQIRFGQNTYLHDSNTATIPFTHKYQSGLYYVTLEAFTIETNRIEFVGKSGTVEEGNIMIDSGSGLIGLPTKFFSQIRHVVAMETNAPPVSDPNGNLDLCYKNNRYLKLPKVVANFKGGDVALKRYNVFVEIGDLICLAVVGTEGKSVYGSLAQQDFVVGFDGIGTVSFLQFECTNF